MTFELDLTGRRALVTGAGQGVGRSVVLGLAAAFDGISMQERYYLRPRMSPTVPCPDC